jgi:predicted outer membrane repeat protein
MIDGKTTDNGGAIFSAEPLTLSNVVVASSEAGQLGGGIAVNTVGKILIKGSRFEQNTARFEGGLYLRGDSGISVLNSTVSYNQAQFTAGLYARADNPHAVILLDHCKITQNIATASGGGLQFATADDGKAILRNTLVSGNVASRGGGGLYFEAGNLIVDHSTFAGNSAGRGGGIATDHVNSVVIKNSQFLANEAYDATRSGGGALYTQGESQVTIVGTIFAGNISASNGGAIANDDATILNIARCTFLGNRADKLGGAIALSDGADFTITGSTLSGNVATLGGGGIAGIYGAHISASGNRLTENQSGGVGGGIYTSGNGVNAVTLSLAGNLFANNGAYEGGGVGTLGEGKVTMKGDKVLGNFTTGSDGGGLYLASTQGITLTGLLVKGNHAADDAGGVAIRGDAVISECKVQENTSDFDDGRGGGIQILSGSVSISKSVVTGNIAADGGGIYARNGTLLTLAKTIVKGNSARTQPNAPIE